MSKKSIIILIGHRHELSDLIHPYSSNYKMTGAQWAGRDVEGNRRSLI
jgi:hypothetical protein